MPRLPWMMMRHGRQGVPTIDPFAPHLSPTLAKGIKEFLVGPRVQEINFDFGSVLVHAPYFTAISRLFVGGLYEKGIHVVVHPVILLEEKAAALYYGEFESMYFESTNVLDDEWGRATTLHECVHAVCDYRRRSTAIRSEEGAAMVAEAWYRLSSDEEVIVFEDYPDSIWEIADRLRGHWLKTGRPVALKGSEINAARAEAARRGNENGFYSNNGIVGA